MVDKKGWKVAAGLCIANAEADYLVGEKYPHGRASGYEDEKRDALNVVPRVVYAYTYLRKCGENIPEFLERIFYLARSIDNNVHDLTNFFPDNKGLVKKLFAIAREGRRISLTEPSSIDERVKQAKLYEHENVFYAAQIRNPERGCSASVCSNCKEPIAFRYINCKTCNFELINAHDMPSIEEWEKLDVRERAKRMKQGFDIMVNEIKQTGDWRGIESSLNRFVPKSNSEWFGYKFSRN